MAKFIPEMHKGGITCYTSKHFTKLYFIIRLSKRLLCNLYDFTAIKIVYYYRLTMESIIDNM